MAVPSKAVAFSAIMDPGELLDFDILMNSGTVKLLADGESAASYTLALYPEAIALGFTIRNDGLYAPVNDGTKLSLWFEVAPEFWLSSAFDGSGAMMAMVLTVTTNSVPPRRRQRTLTLGVTQL